MPCALYHTKHTRQCFNIAHNHLVYVIASAKTVLIGTFSITRKPDLKHSSCCGSVVLDFSDARSRLTVVSREAKKKQHARMSSGPRDHYGELFTQMTALKF